MGQTLQFTYISWIYRRNTMIKELVDKLVSRGINAKVVKRRAK